MIDWTEEKFREAAESEKSFCFYSYTPLCGTCQVASKMMSVIEPLMPHLLMGKADLNYMPEIAEKFQIESVPCLLIFDKGNLIKKVYAFKSVPFIYETLNDLLTHP